MKEFQTLAITLRATPYGERHQIITGLTPEFGCIKAIALNSRHSKRFGGALGVFQAALWELSEKRGSDFVTLKAAQTRYAFKGIQKDFEKLSQAGLFNEMMLCCAPEQQTCEDLFKLHSNALMALDESQAEGMYLPLLNAYFVKLLQWNGSFPKTTHCVCKKTKIEDLQDSAQVSISVEAGSWSCDECVISHSLIDEKNGLIFKLSVEQLRVLKVYGSLPIKEATRQAYLDIEDEKELFSFLESLLIFHLPGLSTRKIKSIQFLPLQSRLKH